MKAFLFYDDVEEFFVIAADRSDAFFVIEEAFGAEAADELISSRLAEYPDDQPIQPLEGSEMQTVGDFVAKSGRGYKRGMPGTFMKPRKDAA